VRSAFIFWPFKNPKTAANTSSTMANPATLFGARVETTD
jgi:hypothetical protein